MSSHNFGYISETCSKCEQHQTNASVNCPVDSSVIVVNDVKITTHHPEILREAFTRKGYNVDGGGQVTPKDPTH